MSALIPITKIVSGGQTGVDRAALDFALEYGIPCGGWCPKGRLAEDGVIDARYPLRETISNGYLQRTHWNVRDSDGTLIVNRGGLSSGTLETYRHALAIHRPVLVIDPDEQQAREKFAAWCSQYDINVLNVAGPRENKSPGIYTQAKSLLRTLILLSQ